MKTNGCQSWPVIWKLPIIDVTDYRPPSWVLPAFAIGSLFLVAFCLTAAFVLVKYPVFPSTKEFEQSYEIIRRLAQPPGEVESARMTIQDYDGASNFRIYINGYRVFGSSSNCVMEYQCKKAGDRAAELSFQEIQSLKVIDASIYHIHRLYSLPHAEDISGLLVSGKNIINVHSENSGLGDCHLQVDLDLSTTAAPKTTFTIEISPNTGSPSSADQPLQSKEVFMSGGLPIAKDDLESNERIPIYNTTRSNGSFRLCQRVRVVFDLSPDQLRTLDSQWDVWAQKRRREIICAIRDDRPEECRK
jgi:hypothetical protein